MNFDLGKHESLNQVSTNWEFGIDGDAVQLEQDMIACMIENGGIGLAANQIGITKRIFVMGSYQISEFPEPFAVFNPVILEASKELVTDQEGCLSFPGLYLTVKRPKVILVQYQNSKGELCQSELDGYISKCFQHELDHLNGVCFIDRVSQMKLQLAVRKQRKNRK